MESSQVGTFTYDWFSGNIGNWNKWLASLRGTPCRALEIGCYEGKATRWLLENILTDDRSRMVVVDTFEGSQEHKESGIGFAGTLDMFLQNTSAWASRVTVYHGSSLDVLRRLQNRFHLIYVDGSHTAADVLTDACLAWPLLEKTGLMIFDDYLWHRYEDPTGNPRLGVDAFLAAFAGRYALVAKDYQVCVQKIS